MDRPVLWNGESQVENGAPSKEHSKWSKPTPISVPEKVNLMDVDVELPPLFTVSLLPSIAEFIVVSGGVASTFHLNDTGDVPWFPTLSTALTSNVWAPLPRLSNWAGLVQAANDAPSREHSISFTPTPVSVPEKVKVIDVDGVPPSADILFLLPSVAEVIFIVGATVSTAQAYSAGDGSSCPELSAALTLNV
jgi:hypothetical protein